LVQISTPYFFLTTQHPVDKSEDVKVNAKSIGNLLDQRLGEISYARGRNR